MAKKQEVEGWLTSGKYWIVKNLALACAAVFVLVLIVSIVLGVRTQHNKEISVPNFTNMTYHEAHRAASHAGVKVIVTDSLYVRQMKPGVVYMQNPKPGAMVKRGRRVRVTVNTTVPKQVIMPSLVGCSLRQAKAELLRNGLVLGRLTYVRDIATNNVIRQLRGGSDITPGRLVDSGTTINLVLGLSSTDSQTYVPKVIGKQYLSAVDLIKENSLNIGKLHFDKTVKTYADSVSAVVYAQTPAGSQRAKMGSEITLSLTNDLDKLPEETKK